MPYFSMLSPRLIVFLRSSPFMLSGACKRDASRITKIAAGERNTPLGLTRGSMKVMLLPLWPLEHCDRHLNEDFCRSKHHPPIRTYIIHHYKVAELCFQHKTETKAVVRKISLTGIFFRNVALSRYYLL
jgi:hypothetical protein